MTQLVTQALPYGLPAPGLQRRDVAPTLIGAGAVSITTTPTTATISVGQLGLTNLGQQTVSYAAASNTLSSAEGAGITVTGPASATVDDILVIGVGSSAVTFSPNGLKVNAQTGNITLLPLNTYLMTYTGSTSGWC